MNYIIMALACSASVCFSNDTTEVDGRPIKFYSYPSDLKLRARWETVCRSVCTSVKNEKLFRLCELHFEKSNFTENMLLTSDAIPTIFDRPVKRKAGNLFQRSNNSAKRHKPENADKNISVTKGEILFTSTPFDVKVEHRESIRIKNQTLNGPLSLATKSIKGPSHYRLIIQIDKIRARPGPKSKKLLRLARLENELKNSKNIQQPLNESYRKGFSQSVEQNLRILDQNKSILSNQHILNNIEKPGLQKSAQNSLNESEQNNSNTSVQKIFQQLINSSVKIPRCNSGCQLENIIWNSHPAFKCKKCNNIYIPQPTYESNKVYESDTSHDSDNIQNQCMSCQKTFNSAKMLYSHIKEHLTCEFCSCLFKTLFEYKNHMRLHSSMNPSKPFQCHLCDLEFDTKISLRNHVYVVHMMTPRKKKQQDSEQLSHQCKKCNLVCVNEEKLRNHMDSHEDKEKSVSSVGQLRSVKFSCIVCGMEFPTLEKIDAHTRIHLETKIEDLRCNICKKLFNSSAILSDHLRQHVANAHRCKLCPKAFINLTSLEMHLKSHV